MGNVIQNQQQAGLVQEDVEVLHKEICQQAFRYYAQDRAELILAQLEPMFTWNFDLAQPAIDLEEQVCRALFWINPRELDSIQVVDLKEWHRSYFDAKTDIARLDDNAAKAEYVQRLENQTLRARTFRRGNQEIEVDFYEWLYKNFRPFMESCAFAGFSDHLQRQLVNVVGTAYASILHPRLLEVVCLPCMYSLAGLNEEVCKCEAELKLFMAGTPLVGIKSLRPVILAKTPVSCG